MTESYPQKISIIGIGLIGGSIGLSLKKFDNNLQITGFDIDKSTLTKALEIGAVDKGYTEFNPEMTNSELIIISTPVKEFGNVLTKLKPFLKMGGSQVITDVSSLKKPIIELVSKVLPDSKHFVGAHPMAGSEVGGISAASKTLFVNRPYILTPVENTTSRAIDVVNWLIRAVGAKSVALPPEDHDLMVSYSSHLPHIIAWSLVSMCGNKPLKIAAQFAGASFRDSTRVALSPSELWTQIINENKENIIKIVKSFIEELKSFEKVIAEGNENKIRQRIEKLRALRLELYEAEGIREDLYRLRIVIPNKPGKLASVTTLLGKAGINIENIEMVHGEGQGVLMIDVLGKKTILKAKKVLEDSGYDISIEGFKETLE